MAPQATTATLLGPLNCQSAIGLPWRRVRELAARHGIERVRVGRTTLVPLDALLAAMRRDELASPINDDPRAAALRALGR